MYDVWQIIHLYTYIWPDLQGFNTMKFKIFKIFQGGIVLSRKGWYQTAELPSYFAWNRFWRGKIKGDNMFLAKFCMDFDFHHKFSLKNSALFEFVSYFMTPGMAFGFLNPQKKNESIFSCVDKTPPSVFCCFIFVEEGLQVDCLCT